MSRRFPAGSLGVIDDCRRLVHVQLWIETDLESLKAKRSETHAEARVARAGGIDGHAAFVRRAQERAVGPAEELFALPHVSSEPPMELRRGHAFLELGGLEHLGNEVIGLEENLGVENDVIDADDPSRRSAMSSTWGDMPYREKPSDR